ncbi:MAG: DUF480 domain-containing protein [Pirellulales bacterium]|nr:DUF480 domain-containing protein [Pirellulales bacterium]
MLDESAVPQTPPAPRWQPLSAIDRRVIGVLAEKAKTTPDGYPMSLNAICTGCNQKSNRDPLMQLEPETVEEALERLREMGAVGMVEGYGRVTKYRHYLYEWMGVEKTVGAELAVMTELLLRGDQTEGELRGRASRMDNIADLNALRTLLKSLAAKNLVVSLTPEGRGHVVTHNLYKPREMENLRAKYAGASAAQFREEPEGESAPVRSSASASQAAPRTVSTFPADAGGAVELRREIEELRGQIKQLRSDLETLSTDHARLAEELRSLKDALGA